MAAKNGEAEAKKFTVQAEKENQRMKSRLKELDNIIRCLYEDRVTGRISLERYDTMSAGCEQEQASLREELAELAAQIEEMDLREKYVREFIEKAKAYVECPRLRRSFCVCSSRESMSWRKK